MSPKTNKFNTAEPPRLFHNNTFNPAAVTEHWPYEPYIRDTALRTRVEHLLELQVQGHDTQQELDSYLHLANMPCCGLHSPMARLLITQSEHLVSGSFLPDIGQIVRRLLIRWPDTSVIFKLYQYSMPFVKHNRLNFPPLRHTSVADVAHLMQAIYVTCLGLHSTSSKRPTWTMRRKIHAFFLYLMQHGTIGDMYIFCQTHVSLVRLALLEHFMHFTHKNMAVETFMMPFLIDSSFDRARVHRLVTFITDNFRQSALQDTDPQSPINWANIHHRAQQAIERCNRTCKAVPVTRAHVNTQSQNFDAKLIQIAFRIPQIYTADLTRLARQYDLQTLSQLYKIHRHIARYPLPIHLQRRQYNFLTGFLKQKYRVTASSTPLLHVCLHCHAALTNNCHNNNYTPGTGTQSANSVNHDVNTRMRVSYLQMPVCHTCENNHHVIVINVLGSLVRIGSKYYHFCVDCHRVHLWTSNATEFSVCAFRPPPKPPPPRRCVVCHRLNGISSMRVVDRRLGLIQTVNLCFKHMPPPSQRPYVHDLVCLRKLIAHNMAQGLGGAKSSIVSYNSDRRSF